MTKILPTYPGALSITPRLITSRTENMPAFGTPDQRFTRMGSRYAIDVKLEPMREEEAMDWVDIETESDTCLWTIPLVDFDPGPVGTPLLNGAGQTGSSVIVDGLTPYCVVRKGQWLSIVTSSRRYLYRCSAETVASSGGAATIPLTTLLRVPHADNDVVELAEPKIEGFVTLPEDAWMMEGSDQLIWLTFTIKENA